LQIVGFVLDRADDLQFFGIWGDANIRRPWLLARIAEKRSLFADVAQRLLIERMEIALVHGADIIPRHWRSRFELFHRRDEPLLAPQSI
jgi:hypothetical protein